MTLDLNHEIKETFYLQIELLQTGLAIYGNKNKLKDEKNIFSIALIKLFSVFGGVVLQFNFKISRYQDSPHDS